MKCSWVCGHTNTSSVCYPLLWHGMILLDATAILVVCVSLGGGTGGRLRDGQRSMWLKCLHAEMGVQHERWSPVHIKEAPFISQWHNKYESLLPNTTLLMTVLDTAVSRAAYQMCSVFTIWIACKKAQLLYSSLREKTDFSEAIDIQWVLFLPIKKEVKGVDFCRYVHKRKKGRNN